MLANIQNELGRSITRIKTTKYKTINRSLVSRQQNIKQSHKYHRSQQAVKVHLEGKVTNYDCMSHAQVLLCNMPQIDKITSAKKAESKIGH